MAGPYVGCAFQDGLKPCVIGVGKGRWLQAGFFGLSIFSRYMLRLARKRWLFRAFRKRRELRAVADRSATLSGDAILVFSTLRNERVRLPFFLRYYREMGVNHFFIVDKWCLTMSWKINGIDRKTLYQLRHQSFPNVSG